MRRIPSGTEAVYERLRMTWALGSVLVALKVLVALIKAGIEESGKI